MFSIYPCCFSYQTITLNHRGVLTSPATLEKTMINSFMTGIMITGVVVGGLYYKTTQNKLYELEQLNMAFELRHQEQAAAYDALQQDFTLQTEALNSMSTKNNEIQGEMNRYLDIFKRHNLTKLAAAKPGLIETRANRATKEVFDGIEKDSAALSELNTVIELQPTSP